MDNVKPPARNQVLMAFFQRIARARGVELVRFVEQFQHAVHLRVVGGLNHRYRHPEVKRLEKLFRAKAAGGRIRVPTAPAPFPSFGRIPA